MSYHLHSDANKKLSEFLARLNSCGKTSWKYHYLVYEKKKTDALNVWGYAVSLSVCTALCTSLEPLPYISKWEVGAAALLKCVNRHGN